MSGTHKPIEEKIRIITEQDGTQAKFADYLLERAEQGKESKANEAIIRYMQIVQKRFMKVTEKEDLLGLSGAISLLYAAYRTDDNGKKQAYFKAAKLASKI